MKLNTFVLGKAIVMFGIGLWLALAVLNNSTDMGTNLYFMQQMMTMSLLKSDPVLGKGLLWRAISSPIFPVLTMYLVVFIEAVASILLLWSSLRLFKVALGKRELIAKAIWLSNIALIVFVCIWMWFSCGDIWFGFWIKNGPFAAMHVLWIIASLLLFIFINYQSGEIMVVNK